MKGIILAGGAGSRLYPMTKVMTKQLQNVYDKPMIYYPLSFLMLGGIRDILLITTPHDQASFQALLGNGENFGIKITYIVQEHPAGLPQAFTLGKDFIKDDDVTLILGDNLFYGDIEFFRRGLKQHAERQDGVTARVFAYHVANPSDYGVVEFERNSTKVVSIEEKPINPKSSFAIPGLYIFDRTVTQRASLLKPSARGELEITDLIKSYLSEGKLGVSPITRGVAWLDTGTPQSLLEASSFIGAVEARQDLKVACLEEVALRMKYLGIDQLKKVLLSMPNCGYKKYLERIVNEVAP
jgi:glucose-1-phosphate thymidylyltransferase